MCCTIITVFTCYSLPLRYRRKHKHLMPPGLSSSKLPTSCLTWIFHNNFIAEFLSKNRYFLASKKPYSLESVQDFTISFKNGWLLSKISDPVTRKDIQTNENLDFPFVGVCSGLWHQRVNKNTLPPTILLSILVEWSLTALLIYIAFSLIES